MEQIFCVAHGAGPFNTDSSSQIQHEKENENCKWETFNSKLHNLKYKKSEIENIYSHTFHFSKGKKQITQDILNEKIQTLRPQTLLSDRTKMILVYLPTRHKTSEGDNENPTITSTFKNSAYFVISRPKTSDLPQREILPCNDYNLIKKYKINVLQEWNDVRWDVTDVKLWESESKKSDPSELYNLVNKTTRNYLEFASESEYTKFNLWNIGTYFYELFNVYPYNDYTGTKRAGKTKSLELQKLVCFNANMSSDITSSATFRIIEGIGATILLDETESFKDKKNEQAQAVRNLLMQGFMKDQYAVRNETSKDRNYTPTQFNLYSPKSLAHINAFDDVLEDRCIQQINQRALDEKIRNTWPTVNNSDFQKIKNLCYRLFLDYADEINELKNEARKLLSVNSRELQLWTPIITMALFFQKHGLGGLTNDVQFSVSKSSQNRQIDDEQDSRDMRILNFLDKYGIDLAKNKELIKGNPIGWAPISELYSKLKIHCDEYEIISEFYDRPQLTDTLKKLGFSQDRKQGGFSWNITESAVNDIKNRMGFFNNSESLDKFNEDDSLEVQSGSEFSDPPRHKSEPNEPNEPNEPKTRPAVSDHRARSACH